MTSKNACDIVKSSNWLSGSLTERYWKKISAIEPLTRFSENLRNSRLNKIHLLNKITDELKPIHTLQGDGR